MSRVDKKIDGPFGIVQKSRNCRIVSVGGVGNEGMMIKRKIFWSPGTNYQHSKIAFAILYVAFSVGHLGHDCCRAVSKTASNQ